MRRHVPTPTAAAAAGPASDAPRALKAPAVSAKKVATTPHAAPPKKDDQSSVRAALPKPKPSQKLAVLAAGRPGAACRATAAMTEQPNSRFRGMSGACPNPLHT